MLQSAFLASFGMIFKADWTKINHGGDNRWIINTTSSTLIWLLADQSEGSIVSRDSVSTNQKAVLS